MVSYLPQIISRFLAASSIKSLTLIAQKKIPRTDLTCKYLILLTNQIVLSVPYHKERNTEILEPSEGGLASRYFGRLSMKTSQTAD